MRLRSVFKMRISILNTAITEQMGYGIISFFVYTKSTNSYLLKGYDCYPRISFAKFCEFIGFDEFELTEIFVDSFS